MDGDEGDKNQGRRKGYGGSIFASYVESASMFNSVTMGGTESFARILRDSIEVVSGPSFEDCHSVFCHNQ